MHIIDAVKHVLYTMRQNGQTSSCIQALRLNPKARMVVGTWSVKNDIVKTYPDVRNRVITVDNMEAALCSLNVPLVWDNTAVLELISRAHKEGRALGQKEGLAVGTSMDIKEREKPAPTVDADTMNQLAKVLSEVGKLYNVNILVIPKPKE